MLPPLSVLDQSPIAEGRTARDAVANTLDLAAQADALGYRRFWLAEHHATPSLASASPEVLLGPILMATSRIRVGTGGVMLPHYSPFKVAESFALLDSLSPGRLDLGLGRAPGTDGLTAYALQQDRRQQAPNDFPRQLAELLAHFDGTLPADHPFRNLHRTLPGGAPEIWILGSSPDSAELAGALGLNYCIADFIAGPSPHLAERYRAAFQPSARAARPRIAVAAWAIAAPTQDEATHLATSARMMFANMMRGHLIPVPHPDVAAAWLAEHQPPERPGRRALVGTPAHVLSGIEAMTAEYRADEVFLVNILHDHAARIRSYTLLADAALTPTARAA